MRRRVASAAPSRTAALLGALAADGFEGEPDQDHRGGQRLRGCQDERRCLTQVGPGLIEFRDGKIWKETRYYAEPFDPPPWRAQWVEPIDKPEPAVPAAVGTASGRAARPSAGNDAARG
jgi:hypothetical protein